MANNNYPQITSVTSETLQAQIRNLLPSQEGFGTDLMAQNVIVPVIDLTAAAEGTTVPEFLQTALAFGSQTEFNVGNATTAIISNTGFYRIIGCATIKPNSANFKAVSFNATDGVTTKKIWKLDAANNSNSSALAVTYDFVVFVNSGETIQAQGSGETVLTGSTRQVADVNGVLVNPSGFNPQ